MNREDWIEQIMHSVDGMDKADPGDELYEKVMERIRVKRQQSRGLALRWAAAAALLLALNVGTAAWWIKHKNSQVSDSQALNVEISMGTSYNY